GLGGREQLLPSALRQPPREQRPAIGVELAHHVVEQHQRWDAARLEQRPAFREQQREESRALLALRAVAAQRAPVERDLQLVEVWAVSGVPAGQVGLAALAELLGELLLPGRLRAGPVTELRLARQSQFVRGGRELGR